MISYIFAAFEIEAVESNNIKYHLFVAYRFFTRICAIVTLLLLSSGQI